MPKFKLNCCSMCESTNDLNANFNTANGKMYFLCNGCQPLHDALMVEVDKAEQIINEAIVNHAINRGIENEI